MNTFRTQKEVLKAQYTAATASASVNEDVAGISSTLGDSGAALQRAQDKIATMQARAGALDELLQSGVLEDVGGSTDDIQQELDEAGTNADVDHELAALKAEIGPGSAPQELTSGSNGALEPRKSGPVAHLENGIDTWMFEVIVHLTGQLHRQVRDMPPGAVSPASPSRLRRRNRGRARVLDPLARRGTGGSAERLGGMCGFVHVTVRRGSLDAIKATKYCLHIFSISILCVTLTESRLAATPS